MAHLIIGANRGIGLGLAAETLKVYPNDTVFATTRNAASSKKLQALADANAGRLIIVELDMVKPETIASALTLIASQTTSLSHLIINAGIVAYSGPTKDMPPSDFLFTLNTNVVGPHSIIQAFYPLLLASTAPKKSLGIISGGGGSLGAVPMVHQLLMQMHKTEYNPWGGALVSKTAVNMLGRQWAEFLEPKGISVSLINPGSVSTDMNKSDGSISVEESARGTELAIALAEFLSSEGMPQLARCTKNAFSTSMDSLSQSVNTNYDLPQIPPPPGGPLEGPRSRLPHDCQSGQRHCTDLYVLNPSTPPSTRAAQFFHSDAADIVGLLCLHRALKGARAADVAELLDWYFDRKGEVSEGQEEWVRKAIFYYHEGTVISHYDPYFVKSIGRLVEAGKIPGHSPAQLEAIEVLQKTAERLALHMVLQVGDIQFVADTHVFHARTAYTDHLPPAPRRHLLRLWLATPESEGGWKRPFKDSAYAKRGGIQVNQQPETCPLDAE